MHHHESKPRKHLLVVDDEMNFRHLICRMLAKREFRITQAADGAEAVNLIRSGLEVDAILIDQRMPKLTGTETFACLRSLGIQTPMILVSALANIDEFAITHGFDAWLEKPISFDDLLNALETLI